jgi:hypothetical protein
VKARAPRWRCLLCPARGNSPTFEQAQADGQQHYIDEHMNKERPTE